MSMKVVYIKDTPDHKAGWEGFIPRNLGRRLCQQEITVPYSVKDYHLGYLEMIKKQRGKNKPIKVPRKKAVSVLSETKETAIVEN